MTGRLRFSLFLTGLCMIAFAQGCVPIYCSLNYANTPDSEPLDLFVWDTNSGYANQPRHDCIAMMPADSGDGWILYDRNLGGYTFGTKQILLDHSYGFVEFLPHRDMRKTTGFIAFTDDHGVYNAANVSIQFEEDTYPQYLEVEAWLRQTLGRLRAPFMGKSGRAFIYDSGSRFACGPPRVAITITNQDGSTTAQRYTLPNTEIRLWEQYGTLISEDGRFLYVYFQDSGAILPLSDGK